MTPSFDAPLSSAREESSARFKEAARNLGGVLAGLGNVVRKTSIGMTLAGVTAFLANTAFITSPANAQTVTLQTDCSTYQPNVLGASGLCEIEKNKLAHQQLDRAQSQLARDRAEERKEDVLAACLAQLVAYKKSDPVAFSKLGTVTRDNACTLSKGLPPRPTAAASPLVGG